VKKLQNFKGRKYKVESFGMDEVELSMLNWWTSLNEAETKGKFLAELGRRLWKGTKYGSGTERFI